MDSCTIRVGKYRAEPVYLNKIVSSITLLLLLRTSKILHRLNVLIFFQQFEAQNVLILFLTAIYSFMVENRLQRPSERVMCL